MTDERVERAFRDHPDFEPTDDGAFETPAKPFENVVSVEEDGDAHRYEVVVRTPTLDAAVEGETVADVVEDGWFETLELRLDDAHEVAETDDAAPPEIEREGDEVVVTVEFASDDPERAAEDALAVAEYVEGTWVQGIIPGYDYRDPAASLRERARQNYGEGERGGGEGGRSSGEGGESGPGGPSGGPPL
ncbi:DUF5813 family protein [Halorussus sp. AFM4]|uniref:DUF5813 family protein n=1 Tax=Halorussus sp. AFM4 TaxID=3421651 RepID=UPI003EBAFC4F